MSKPLNVIGVRITLGHSAYGPGTNSVQPNLTIGEALDGLLALGVDYEEALAALTRAIMGSHTTAWAGSNVVELSRTP